MNAEWVKKYWVSEKEAPFKYVLSICYLFVNHKKKNFWQNLTFIYKEIVKAQD